MEENFVVCRVCDKHLRRIDNGHIQKVHGITPEQYRSKYPDDPMICEAYRKNISDTIKKIHANPNSVYKSEEYRKKKKASSLKMWSKMPEDKKASRSRKISNAVRKYYIEHPEACEEISNKTTQQWADIEKRDKLLDGLHASWTDDRKKNASEKWKKLHQNPSSPLGTEECNQQISQAITNIWKQENSPYRTEKRSHKISITSKERWRDGTMDGVFVSPTKPELATEEFLKSLRLPYKFQHRITGDNGTYIIDFVVGDTLLIEVFGDYWHGPEKPEQQSKDQQRLDWLEENGYDTLVLWEHEINEDPEFCLDIIKNHVKEFNIWTK